MLYDVGAPDPCNPWGYGVGDDLSFVMPNSCSACRVDDPIRLGLAR